MSGNRKQFFYLALGFLLLCLISLYRQLSMDYLPGDFLRPYLVYAVYLFLIFAWMWSIRSRVTQKNMRFFMLAEGWAFFAGLSIRFVQEAFLQDDIFLLRYTGLLILIPTIALPLEGLYAACGLGQAESYTMPKRLYWLLLPALLLCFGAVTDPWLHINCLVDPNEPQPNIYFHPYIGTYAIYIWVLALIVLRISLIFRRNRRVRSNSRFRMLAPFMEPIMLLVYITPYSMASFFVDAELIEFYAAIYFIVAAGWEFVIAAGLVPVNTHYEKVFDCSTVAMQITDDKGLVLARSCRAPALAPGDFEALRRDTVIRKANGKELWQHEVPGGYLIWQKNVAELHQVIDELDETAKELEQESALLSRELQTRSEKSALRAQNRIYNELTDEVGDKLSLIRRLMKEAETAADKASVFRRICVLGTYVKRRCNLRLIERSEGKISAEDLEFSFQELLHGLHELGISALVEWREKAAPSAEFGIACFDLFEALIEFGDFGPGKFEVLFEAPDRVSVTLRPGKPGIVAWAEGYKGPGCLRAEALPDGFRLTLREGGQHASEE